MSVIGSASCPDYKSYGISSKKITSIIKDCFKEDVDSGNFIFSEKDQTFSLYLKEHSLMSFPPRRLQNIVCFTNDSIKDEEDSPSNSIGYNFLRHIRNGFAHGRVALRGNKQWLALEDINPKSKKVTARMFLNINILLKVNEEIHSLIRKYESKN